MGVDILGGNQVASKIPSDFFMKQSQITLEDASREVDLSHEPPAFEYTEDYFNKFWTSFVDNEKILNEIQDVATENQRSLN